MNTSFLFFILLTVVMGFMINWAFGSFFSTCQCERVKNRENELEELRKLNMNNDPTTKDNISSLLD